MRLYFARNAVTVSHNQSFRLAFARAWGLEQALAFPLVTSWFQALHKHHVPERLTVPYIKENCANWDFIGKVRGQDSFYSYCCCKSFWKHQGLLVLCISQKHIEGRVLALRDLLELGARARIRTAVLSSQSWILLIKWHLIITIMRSSL